MRKFVLIIFLLGTIGFAWAGYIDNSALDNIKNYFYFSPCDTPIRYSIGRVDSRFDLSRNEFLSDIVQAESKWASIAEGRLFTYDPQGPLVISMVYDKRQMLTNEINNMEGQVDQKKSSLDTQIAQYEKESANLKQKIADLNNRIDYYNSRGGAPLNEYNKLINEQQDLKTEADRLNAIANNLNLSTESYNADLETLQKTIGTFNAALVQKPEEGLYDSKTNTITIYFNNGKDELMHTLMHEMGHALGIAHVNDQNAIMYPYASSEIIPTSADISELQNVCKKKSVFELLKARYSAIVR